VVIGGLQPEVSHEPDGHPPAPSFPELVSPEDEARVAAQLLLQPHQAAELLSRCSPREFVMSLPRAVAAATEALTATNRAPHLLAVEAWIADCPDHPTFAVDEIGSLTDVFAAHGVQDTAFGPGEHALQSADTIRNLARQRQLAGACALVRGRAGPSVQALALLSSLDHQLDRLRYLWARHDGP